MGKQDSFPPLPKFMNEKVYEEINIEKIEWNISECPTY